MEYFLWWELKPCPGSGMKRQILFWWVLQLMEESKVGMPLLYSFHDGYFLCLVLSLPTFRQLLETPLDPNNQNLERILKTTQFSTGGLGSFFKNQNQVQKFSINKEETKLLFDSYGKMFQEKIEMPDPPKQSFFKGFLKFGSIIIF